MKPADIHRLAKSVGVNADTDSFRSSSQKLIGKSHLDDMSSAELGRVARGLKSGLFKTASFEQEKKRQKKKEWLVMKNASFEAGVYDILEKVARRMVNPMGDKQNTDNPRYMNPDGVYLDEEHGYDGFFHYLEKMVPGRDIETYWRNSKTLYTSNLTKPGNPSEAQMWETAKSAWKMPKEKALKLVVQRAKEFKTKHGSWS